MTWTVPAPAFTDGPLIGPDRPILEAYLSWQRATFLNICAGLTADQLATRPLVSSNLSLLGLIRHLAKVEHIWFRIRATRTTTDPMFDPALGKDIDFNGLDPAEAETALARLVEEWRWADTVVTGLSFDDTVATGDEVWSLRMLYVHLIGEYTRHNGHADLLREAIDGITGR